MQILLSLPLFLATTAAASSSNIFSSSRQGDVVRPKQQQKADDVGDVGVVDFGFGGVSLSEKVALDNNCANEWEVFYGCAILDCPSFLDECPEMSSSGTQEGEGPQGEIEQPNNDNNGQGGEGGPGNGGGMQQGDSQAPQDGTSSGPPGGTQQGGSQEPQDDTSNSQPGGMQRPQNGTSSGPPGGMQQGDSQAPQDGTSSGPPGGTQQGGMDGSQGGQQGMGGSGSGSGQSGGMQQGGSGSSGSGPGSGQSGGPGQGGGQGRRLQPGGGGGGGDTKCVADIPTDNTNSVEISLYRNEAGGTFGDDCPVSCEGEPMMVQFYAIADAENQCFQWPGQAGENSMKSGTCHTEDKSYTFDQWTNCECDGAVGNSKDAFVDKCVIDNPTTLCAKITDYSACESGTTATAEPVPDPDTGAEEAANETLSCEQVQEGYCETYGTDGCCLQDCTSEHLALMKCVIQETTGESLDDCSVSCSDSDVEGDETMDENDPMRVLDGFELDIAGVSIGHADSASICQNEWATLAESVLLECPNVKDVCPFFGPKPGPEPEQLAGNENITVPQPGQSAGNKNITAPTCPELEDRVCRVIDFRLTNPNCCLSTASNAIYDLLICKLLSVTGQDRSSCSLPGCIGNETGTVEAISRASVSVNSSFLISTQGELTAANLKEQLQSGNSEDIKLLQEAYGVFVKDVVSTIEGSQGQQQQQRRLLGGAFSIITGERKLQKKGLGFDTNSTEIYDFLDTSCDVLVVSKQTGSTKTCITVFGKYSIVGVPLVDAQAIYDKFVQETSSAIASGKLEESLKEVQIDSNTTSPFVVEGVSPTFDTNHVAIVSDAATIVNGETSQPLGNLMNDTSVPSESTEGANTSTLAPTPEPTPKQTQSTSAGGGYLSRSGAVFLSIFGVVFAIL